jgi:hypothetical protein
MVKINYIKKNKNQKELLSQFLTNYNCENCTFTPLSFGGGIEKCAGKLNKETRIGIEREVIEEKLNWRKQTS